MGLNDPFEMLALGYKRGKAESAPQGHAKQAFPGFPQHRTARGGTGLPPSLKHVETQLPF